MGNSSKDTNDLTVAAASALARSQAMRERAAELLDRGDIAVQKSQLLLDNVPSVLATAFNARFSDFWEKQMQGATEEMKQQMFDWIDLHAKGILANMEGFTAGIAQADLRLMVASHLSALGEKGH